MAISSEMQRKALVHLFVWCQLLFATGLGWPFGGGGHGGGHGGAENGATPADDHLLLSVEPFHDGILPESQLGGQNVPGLGSLMALNTLMSANSVQSSKTSFSIHTRSKTITGVKFIPLNERSAFWSRFTFRSKQQADNGGDSQQKAHHYQYDLQRLIEFGFDAGKKTVVVIPGYRTPETTDWMNDIVQGLLALHGDHVQVITVSWSDSNQGIYSTAVANTILIARQLTIFLYYLLKTSREPRTGQLVDNWNKQPALDNIHLVGHSCGAHIAGFVGQDLGGRVGRITGLDPAGPSFDQFPSNQRLDRSDAKLVEVLHTNSGKLRYMKALASTPMMAFNSFWSDAPQGSGLVRSGITTSGPVGNPNYRAWFGIDLQVGHIDYYANDGSNQPGCRNDMRFCEHHRAVHIFIDLLRYEIAVHSFNLQEEGNGFGLLAYKAASYNSFETGESFALECGDLLSASASHLNKAHQDEALRKCAVPLIDMRRPLNDLIGQLEHRFGVVIREDKLRDSQRQAAKYYFKTSAGELSVDSRNELVGDHYLLRVYLADGDQNGTDNELAFRWREPLSGNDNWCSLRTQFIMEDGEVMQMEMGHLRKSQVQLVEGGEHEQGIIAIPFVHPAGSSSRLQLERLLAMGSGDQAATRATNEPNERLASAGFSEGLRRLLPRSIVMTLSEVQPDGACGACQLTIRALELQPLDGRQGIGVLYGPNLSLEERIPMKLGGEFVDLLKGDPSGQHELSSLTRLRTCPGCGMKSYAVGLEAILTER